MYISSDIVCTRLDTVLTREGTPHRDDRIALICITPARGVRA